MSLLLIIVVVAVVAVVVAVVVVLVVGDCCCWRGFSVWQQTTVTKEHPKLLLCKSISGLVTVIATVTIVATDHTETVRAINCEK